MTIHFFTKGDKLTASSRQRAYNIAEEFSDKGVKTVINHGFQTKNIKSSRIERILHILKFGKKLLQAKKTDVIFLQRTVYSSSFVYFIYLHKVLFKRKIIFDFDDSIHLHMPKQTRQLTKIANNVLVGSNSLKKWALQYNENVHLIPTAINFNIYKRYSTTYIDKKQTTIGWVGNGPAHFENLLLFVPVLKKLIEKRHKIKMVIVGTLYSKKVKSLFDTLEGAEVVFVDNLEWADHTAVPKAIQQFDIGIMPLQNTAWNEGKCAFKAIEYMACGVPVVISAVGENLFLVEDGKNGFSAKDTEEWVMKIEKLITDRELRFEIGKKGQKTIKAKYSYEAIIPKMFEIIMPVDGNIPSKN